MREILNIAFSCSRLLRCHCDGIELGTEQDGRHRDGRDEEPNPSWNDWSSCHATKRPEELSGGASATALIDSRTCCAEGLGESHS